MVGLEKALASVDGVKSIHHLHVWALSTTENALSVHAVITDVSRLSSTIAALKTTARSYGITHSTIEAENGTPPCDNHSILSAD